LRRDSPHRIRGFNDRGRGRHSDTPRDVLLVVVLAEIYNATMMAPFNQDDTKPARIIKRRIEPPADPKTVFIPNIPPTCSVKNILTALNKIDSGKVTRILVSDPKPTKKFIRVAYVTYSSEEAAKEAITKINGTMVSEYCVEIVEHQPRYEHMIPRVTPQIASTHARIHKDLDQIRTLTRLLDKSLGIEKNILLHYSHLHLLVGHCNSHLPFVCVGLGLHYSLINSFVWG